MIEATTRVLAPLLMTALMFGALSGCTNGGDGDGDKAGGSDAPKVLRLAVADDADQPDAPFARYFARRAAALSDGSVRVRVVWDAAGQSSPGYELGIAQRVHDGDFELGWMGSRAWDRMGIKSFQALQAPFLVTDYGLLGRIAAGPLAERMLAGLDGHGFVGLGLVPEHLRYAFGVRAPLASVGDFAGARVRVRPSEASDALMRALGAKPVHISGDDVAAAVADGEIEGAEASLGTNSREEGENHLTVNLPLFPKTLTLFAGEDAYERLDAGQREAIRDAARETAAYAAAHPPSERALMREFCGGGRLVSAVAASRGDLDALEGAAQPVYTQLEEDPDTKALIAAIRALKAASPAHPTAVPPAGCVQTTRTESGRKRPPSTVNGTYHWRVTEPGAHAAARAVGASPHADDEDIGAVGKMTLRDGKWLLGLEDPEGNSGTYEIVGNRLVFDWGGDILTFEFAREGDGTIQLEPLRPMNPGDAVVWAGGPWRRVGPPVREIP
ncbi:MAG: TRAP transporter substrate-binding protein DctP [Thermoleophilaceae bacterium]|nr:TRAP transporter substrate-binding protein DctP [Thermoleophilaceae bacterium]